MNVHKNGCCLQHTISVRIVITDSDANSPSDCSHRHRTLSLVKGRRREEERAAQGHDSTREASEATAAAGARVFSSLGDESPTTAARPFFVFCFLISLFVCVQIFTYYLPDVLFFSVSVFLCVNFLFLLIIVQKEAPKT